jgi:hypothetical protein
MKMSLLSSSKFLFRAILVVFGIRILLAALFPLTSDEGYYWLWSRFRFVNFVCLYSTIRFQ